MYVCICVYSLAYSCRHVQVADCMYYSVVVHSARTSKPLLIRRKPSFTSRRAITWRYSLSTTRGVTTSSQVLGAMRTLCKSEHWRGRKMFANRCLVLWTGKYESIALCVVSCRHFSLIWHLNAALVQQYLYFSMPQKCIASIQTGMGDCILWGHDFKWLINY